VKGAKYNMVVIDDPSGVFEAGARIPFQEFLIGLSMGSFTEGMKVSKRAIVSEFVVGADTIGQPALVDVYQHTWRPHSSGRYFQLRRTSWR